MKHKYADMIKERVDNMDLVLLVKTDGNWRESSNDLPVDNGFDYFLCHPKHERQTIHWLDGGEVIFEFYGDEFIEIREGGDQWSPHLWCMQEEHESRIRSKKEKRWIVVYGSDVKFCISNIFSSHDKAERYKRHVRNGQIVDIEIEVD